MIIELNNEQDFLVYDIKRGGNVVEITDIIVNTERRVGTGTKLFNQLIKSLESKAPYNLFVLTRRSNKPANEFYRSLGFRFVSILPEFYLEKTVNNQLLVYEDAVVYNMTVK